MNKATKWKLGAYIIFICPWLLIAEVLLLSYDLFKEAWLWLSGITLLYIVAGTVAIRKSKRLEQQGQPIQHGSAKLLVGAIAMLAVMCTLIFVLCEMVHNAGIWNVITFSLLALGVLALGTALMMYSKEPPGCFVTFSLVWLAVVIWLIVTTAFPKDQEPPPPEEEKLVPVQH